MDERQFRAFVSIVEAGRMDLAAQALGYSQPAISYQIKCLESSLRAKLFTRDSTGARLTPQGEMLLPTARAVVTLLDTVKQTFDQRQTTEAAINMVHGDSVANGRTPPHSVRPTSVPARRTTPR